VKKGIRVACVLGVVLALSLGVAGTAVGKPATYWSGGQKLTFVADEYGHINIVYPACVTPVETYMWVVYDPNGDWFAGSNYETPGGQFTPTISGRYKVVVKAMTWPDTMDTLKGAYRYTAP
jgi:hypothetical protein